jgi:hypothetical protein
MYLINTEKENARESERERKRERERKKERERDAYTINCVDK